MTNFPRAILFDLDGTLVDSAPDMAIALTLTFKELNMKPHTDKKIRQWVGNGIEKLLHRALTNSMDGIAEEHLMYRAKKIFFAVYPKTIGQYSKLYKGVKHTLEELLEKEIKLGCVTNKNRAFTIPLLEKMGIKKYFEAIVCGDDIKYKKPEPDALHRAAKQLGFLTEQCLMVGDSKIDITAANRAGMKVICVDYGYNQGENLSCLNIKSMISDFREIQSLLNTFNLNSVSTS